MVIGHGLWLLLVTVTRALFEPGLAAVQAAQPPRLCRNCGEVLSATRPRCAGCGLTRAEADELTELRTTERRLARFRDAHQIDDHTFVRLRELIDRRQR